MSDDLMDEAAQRLFPELHARNLRAAAQRFMPGTTRRQSHIPPTSDDMPGRTLLDRSKLPTRDDHSPIWAKHPKYIGNHPEPFYPIGALAEALERDSNTMRAWITNGWLPDAQYRKKTSDVRGRRRYYTRAQIEGLVQLAAEERLLGTNRRSPGSTRFPQRARELFARLAAEPRRTA